MTWQRQSSSICEAAGKDGRFRIERRRGQYWAQYGSEIYRSFNLPPKDTLTAAKAMCEDNEYWEAQ